MATLPTPGGDTGTWGTELNTFLQVAHNADGTISGAWLNVQHYGATGNGSTDDAAAIQDALDAASADGGTVYFPEGVYRTSLPLSISGINVSVRGAGMGATTLTVLPADFGNFQFAYVITPLNQSATVAAGATIADLTIDGQKRNGANPASQCGGILAGNDWRIYRVMVDDPNYFGFFVTDVENVWLVDCQSARGGNNDAIGGGGTLSNVHVIRHLWTSTTAGNRLDLAGGTGVNVIDCRDESANVGDILFEGVTDSLIQGCRMLGAVGITVKDDTGYSPTTATNPRAVRVLGNYLYGNSITLTARSYAGGYANTGGFNVIAENVVDTPYRYGIGLAANAPAGTYAGGDIVANNIVMDGNSSGSVSYNTGMGNLNDPSIGVIGMPFAKILGNQCIDTRGASRRVPYQIQVGKSDGNVTNYTDIFDNTISGYATAAILVENTGTTAILRGNRGYNPVGGAVTQPSVAGSGTAVNNPTGVDCQVYLTAGTVTAINVAGTATGLTYTGTGSASVRVPAGSSVKLTYTGTPTWKWFGD